MPCEASLAKHSVRMRGEAVAMACHVGDMGSDRDDFLAIYKAQFGRIGYTGLFLKYNAAANPYFGHIWILIWPGL